MSSLREWQAEGMVGRWFTIGALCVGTAAGVTGCTAAAGAGVAAVAIGAAIATSECYGYVDVLVTDGVTGNRACDAKVSATRDDEVVPFTSCFYAPLTEGRWRLAVEKPGYESVTSEIEVDPKEHCERVVHYISVRLDSLSAPSASDWTARPMSAPASGPPAAASPPSSAPTGPASSAPGSTDASPPVPAPPAGAASSAQPAAPPAPTAPSTRPPTPAAPPGPAPPTAPAPTPPPAPSPPPAPPPSPPPPPAPSPPPPTQTFPAP